MNSVALQTAARPASGLHHGWQAPLLGTGLGTLVLLASLMLCGGEEPQFVPGRLLVRTKSAAPASELAARLKTQLKSQPQRLSGLEIQVLSVEEENLSALLAELSADPDVVYAERDGLARAAFVSNSPAFSGAEWHLAKIQAPQAWGLTAGRTNTIVAVLDSGINGAHPDFANRLLAGYNFVSGSTDTSDDFGHGTAVAGVVVAAGNNDLGVVGVAYGCRLLPVKVVDVTGFAYYSTIAQGVHYAVDNGARVINISIAGNSPSATLQDAVNYAWSRNVLVIAAAGNNGNDLPQYPAACDNVVAVSATETNDTLAGFSSYGNFITLAAPGNNIWTTQSELSNPYGAWSGTSFSSPIVAATAALAASINPALSNTQLVSVLERNADDLGQPGFDASFGYGRVNASRVVQMAYALRFPPQPPQFAHVTIAWPAVAGRTYRIQYTTATGGNNWTTLLPDVTATGDQATKSDDLAAASQRSYRVLLLP